MAPRSAVNPVPKTQKGSGKNKSKQEGQPPQTSIVEFGLPTSAVTALQSISARATQDLWTTSTFASDNLTADQLAQRRTNAMAKLAKRINGDMRAKTELATSLGVWFAQISQHLMGLVGRMRAISNKLDEDLNMAVQDMQNYLVDQPSSATSDQVAQAMQQIGPIWTPPQEQEVVRMAALLRAFGSVAPAIGQAAVPDNRPLLGGGPLSWPDGETDTFANDSFRSAQPQLAHTLMPTDLASEHSFGGIVDRTSTQPPTTVQGPRWKRRSLTSGHRPSKSPRREPPPVPGPWQVAATGRTPEGLRREATTALEEDEPELLPEPNADTPMAAKPMTWSQSWRQLASFSVEHGADPIGSLSVDESQNAVLPLPGDDGSASAVVQQAEHVWMMLKESLGQKDDRDLLSVCKALHHFLQLVRQNPSALPQVRQGLMLAAHVTVGGLLDPYSYAPVTAQEWLFPALLLEQGGPIRGFLPAEISSAPEVQGVLRQPSPFLLHISGDQPISEASFSEGGNLSPGL